ncbi:tetratricopeptide repeat protein [Streptomyces litchfieldiae]|uniref:Tetratricopeptide repeat protein n=1 Tax=Streptomyces litchfieldiae TaxID=3075543 RepID=A0ABU2MTJ3_9ACTN|nr:tetratricopeptide repeat protein [Streptomyces sp. DSM 44938]MDT0344958.1 tetratricopeptide repeat protein [Streptomyces sp. DSM 44938]
MTTTRVSFGARPGANLSASTEADGTVPTGTPLHPALVLSRSRAAARSGDLDEALRLLRSADDPAVGGHRDVLDLLARVHAQRGELTEAAAAWRRVQERHPQDPAALAGLARIERLRRGGPRAAFARHRTHTALAAAVCAVTALAAGAAALIDGTDGGPPTRHSALPAEQAEQIAQRLEAERETELAQQRAREEARRAAAADALARALQAPGLHPVVRQDSVEVAFTEGLFSEGAELTTTGADRLAVLGERLAGRQVRVEIFGHAATVPGAPSSGGSVVSLWRALIAARELSAASGKSLTEFTTASADQRDAPYESAERNRTVTVVITPA